MGDVSFDIKFNMLRNGDIDDVLSLFHVGSWMKTLLTPVLWAFELVKAIPRGWTIGFPLFGRSRQVTKQPIMIQRLSVNILPNGGIVQIGA